MRTGTGRRVGAALVVGAAVAASTAGVRGAMRTAHARQETALEARVLDGDIAFLERRVAADPRNHLLAGLLVDRYAERFQASADLGDLHRAAEVAHGLAADRPDEPAAWTRLARVLLTRHSFPEAYEAAGLAARLAPSDEGVLGVFVDAARAVGAYAAADSALARIPEGSVAAVLRSWRALARAGAGPQARRRLRRVCARFDELGRSRDTRAWCRVRLADTALLEGRRDQGERWLDEALRIQPDHRGAIETRAGLALKDERWALATRLLERIATAAHPDIYLTLSEAYRAAGRSREAERAEARFLDLATAPGALDLNALFLARYYADGRRDCARAGALIGRELQRRRSVEALREAAAVVDRCGDPDAAESLRAEVYSLDVGGSGARAAGGVFWQVAEERERAALGAPRVRSPLHRARSRRSIPPWRVECSRWPRPTRSFRRRARRWFASAPAALRRAGAPTGSRCWASCGAPACAIPPTPITASTAGTARRSSDYVAASSASSKGG